MKATVPVARRRASAAQAESRTATQRVYQGVYDAIVEHRLAPGTRLREEELAQGFGVSRTVVRQALQRLAADHVIELQHNRGAQVPHPDPGQVQRVFEARRVVECDIVRRLAGRLESGPLEALEALVAAEAEAMGRGDRAAAVRLSGQFHHALAELGGNPVFVRWIDELLPTTSLLIMLYQRGAAGCVAHGHRELIEALRAGPAGRAATEMRRHLGELERSLGPGGGSGLRDLFAAYREPGATA